MKDEQLVVSEGERTGTPKDLFFIWFANNIGILGIVMGAMITSFGLNLIQSIIAACLAALSFTIVGLIAVIGQSTGITTFILSRAAFGIKGNLIPNFVAWLNLIGWLCVNVVTGSLIINTVFKNLFGVESSAVTVISLGIFTAFVLLSGTIRPENLAKVQTLLTYVFGGLTLVILVILVRNVDWQQVLATPYGSWSYGFWPAVSIIAAGTGINWAIAGADYGAYQQRESKGASVFFSTTLGAFIPLFIILIAGVLVGTVSPTLSTSTNPMSVIQEALPNWIATLYLITAVGGIIPQCIVSLQSAKMNVDALNIKASQGASLTFHGILMVGLPLYVLFFSTSFLEIFQLFLGLLGILLASWAAVFLIDYWLNRKAGYELELMKVKGRNQAQWPAVVSWGSGVVIGFLFTNTGFFDGPFAKGVFQDNSLGVMIAMAVSAILMFVLTMALGGTKNEH